MCGLFSIKMDYSSSWFGFLDYICYPFTFYFCKFTGILPSHVNGESFTIESLFYTAAGLRTANTVSKAGYFYGFVFIMVNSVLVTFLYYIEDSTPTNKPNFYMALINSIPAYIIIPISIFPTSYSTIECIYSACLRYCMSTNTTKSCGFVCVSVLVYFLVLLCYYGFSLHFLDNNLFDYTILLHSEFIYSPLFTTSLLLSLLCLIAERIFIHINGQLREISKMRFPEKATNQIEILMFYHEVVTDFVEETNSCFRLHLVILLLDFTHQLIFISYIMTLSRQRNINSILITGLLYLARLIKFVIVCSCSQRVRKQINALRVHIQSIKVNYRHRLDPTLALRLADFSKAVNERSAILTAAGFTEIDLNLIFKLTGIAVMYAFAALQYNGLTQ